MTSLRDVEMMANLSGIFSLLCIYNNLNNIQISFVAVEGGISLVNTNRYAISVVKIAEISFCPHDEEDDDNLVIYNMQYQPIYIPSRIQD